MSRYQLYPLFIVIAAAIMLGKIAAVDRVDVQQLQRYRLNQVEPLLADKEKRLRKITDNEEQILAELERTREKLIYDAVLQSPMLCGNDRSRWATIRALVEPEMRVKDNDSAVWYAIDEVQNIKGWDTIDMVKHPIESGGKEYLFSSKPPLLPTLMTIPYAAIYWGSGQTISLGSHPYLVVRTMLVLFNFIPLCLCWILLIALIEQFGTTDWGRIFAAAAVCFGTFLPAFANTLNNHLPAVVAVAVAFYCFVKILHTTGCRLPVIHSFLAGVCAFFAVSCELPALSFCVFLGGVLAWFARNLPAGGGAKRRIPAAYCLGILVVAIPFFATNYIAHRTVRLAYSQRSWYFYEYERGGAVRDSYWKNPVGIDKGEPSRAEYILHSTVGHHGIFLLTPVFLLSFYGLGIWISNKESAVRRTAAVMILSLSIIVFMFYMMQKQPNRNYGGMTCALRWMFWLVPLWLVPLVSAADKLSQCGTGRAAALFLLGVSVFSCSYPVWNPWTMPWAYNLMYYFGIPVLL
ncbi:MAG: hypothetical protein LBN39_00185 [Planctomycetaceae bacterium]|nr:hypothetical protein [Planctomycetaceae bacterium]